MTGTLYTRAYARGDSTSDSNNASQPSPRHTMCPLRARRNGKPPATTDTGGQEPAPIIWADASDSPCGLSLPSWSRMTTETANTWLGWARHDARPGSRIHRAGAVENKQRRGRGGRDDPRSCVLVAGAGPLRWGQDLTGSAVPADVAQLLSHRHHEPSYEASHDG
jgi:hypothetical protein